VPGNGGFIQPRNQRNRNQRNRGKGGDNAGKGNTRGV
jgi:hypothetical protein